MSLEVLQLASLMHDIGKFFQRTGIPHHKKYKKLTKNDFGRNGAHSKWSATFISDYGLGEAVEDLVLYHHQPKNSNNPKLAKILQYADHHSSKERVRRGETKEVKKEPLISVFSKVQINENNQPEEYYLPLRELNPHNLSSIKPQMNKSSVFPDWNLNQIILNYGNRC